MVQLKVWKDGEFLKNKSILLSISWHVGKTSFFFFEQGGKILSHIAEKYSFVAAAHTKCEFNLIEQISF